MRKKSKGKKYGKKSTGKKDGKIRGESMGKTHVISGGVTSGHAQWSDPPHGSSGFVRPHILLSHTKIKMLYMYNVKGVQTFQ
jgi:hypothetical protein